MHNLLDLIATLLGIVAIVYAVPTTHPWWFGWGIFMLVSALRPWGGQ